MMSPFVANQHVVVSKEYQATYPNPIAVKTGDTLLIGQRDTDWSAFVWCTGPDRRVGWMPSQFFEQHTETSGTALRDYDAKELNAQAGESLTLLEELGGWWWAINAHGESGWIPVENLVGVNEE